MSHPTACILCSQNCGLEVEIEDGHVTKVRGDAAHPVSLGYLCQKAARIDYYQHAPSRVHQPLRRQPDGSFEPVDWDTAVQTGPRINELTWADHRDAVAGTPFHKTVPVQIRPVA